MPLAATKSDGGERNPCRQTSGSARDLLKERLSDSQDVIFNGIRINSKHDLCFTVIYIDGLINTEVVDDFVLKPLIQEAALSASKTEKDLIDQIMLGTVYHNLRRLREKLGDCLGDLLTGSVLLVFDKSGVAVTFETKGFEKRSITEPTNENVLKGSKESFIEVIRINTALVRRRIPDSDLKISHMSIGKRSNTFVAVVYFKGIANAQLVNEVKKRLGQINIDGIVSAAQIENLIMDSKHSIFPQMLYTERLDRFCGNILEGRVGILIDGLPFCLYRPRGSQRVFAGAGGLCRQLSPELSVSYPAVFIRLYCPRRARFLRLHNDLSPGDDPDKACSIHYTE